MAHKLDRQMKGTSGKFNGYIIDNPDRDPNVPILHHVYCAHKKCIFILTKEVYDENVRQLDQNRRNDHHRIQDAEFSVGDYIVFTIEKNPKYGINVILDFEKAENPMDLEFDNGTNVFKSLCVFNKDINKVYSEHFGEFSVTLDSLQALDKIPTHDVVLVCSLSWEMINGANGELSLMPSINKIRHIEADRQDFATKAEWNKKLTKCAYNIEDDEVDFEESEEQQIGAITGQKGFITGLTSVLIPDHPTKTVLMPYHEVKEHEIGRETKCDIVHNDVLDCYIVFSQRIQISTHYPTFISKKGDDIEALFYVTIYLDECFHGFYKHKQFYYISDPYGYLESARYIISQNPSKFNFSRVITVPVRDRLSNVRDTRKSQDLDIVTRLEIMGPGNDEDQLEMYEICSKNMVISVIRSHGIVLDEKEGRVFGYMFIDARSADKNLHGFTIKLPFPHPYKTGDHILFSAKQTIDPDFPRPTLYISEHSRDNSVCNYKDGWFILDATYNEKFNCYESNVFGLIPCDKAPFPSKGHRKGKNQIQRKFSIKAQENRNVPRQTVLTCGKFLREFNV